MKCLPKFLLKYPLVLEFFSLSCDPTNIRLIDYECQMVTDLYLFCLQSFC